MHIQVFNNYITNVIITTDLLKRMISNKKKHNIIIIFNKEESPFVLLSCRVAQKPSLDKLTNENDRQQQQQQKSEKTPYLHSILKALEDHQAEDKTRYVTLFLPIFKPSSNHPG